MAAVKLLFFARFKEQVGCDEMTWPLAERSSIKQLLIELEKTIPRGMFQTKGMRIAINNEITDNDRILQDGDEVAFFPPFSGGSDHIPTERVRIQQGDFSIDEEIAKLKAISKRIGGIVSFLGSARDFSKGRDILKIEFSHFPEMAEAALAKIREEALQKFDILDVTLIHRFGPIAIGDNIVLIVVGAVHRRDAFAACAWCIDRLKETAPIWKKETTPQGTEWVEDRP